MMWALLVLLAAIVVVHWWEYRTTVQEYTFAQPATLDKRGDLRNDLCNDLRNDLRSVLSEKTPIAMEIGVLPWRPEIASKAQWTVVVNGTAMSVQEWDGVGRIENRRELASEIGLDTGLTDIAEARAWWWLPGLHGAEVHRLAPAGLLGLTWPVAERRWVGCSHGGPLTVWLVHSRYRRYLKANDGADPWSLTAADAPWIGRVQFVEVLVKPGWCLGVPAHWGYAVKADENAWVWTADQHSPLSWSLQRLRDRVESANNDDETLEDSE